MRPRDYDAIRHLSLTIYPELPPWTEEYLAQHHAVFPDGQLVAVTRASGAVVGYAASLVVQWDDYDIDASWREMTADGRFTNHDPAGRTLYGAEVMVAPDARRTGVGSAIYDARRALARRLRFRRIRAGARLRGYHRYADRMSPEAYVEAVVRGDLTDPTLTFQLRQRFRVLAVVEDYLHHDPASLGHAAIIEWLNHAVARLRDYAGRSDRFAKPRRRPGPRPHGK